MAIKTKVQQAFDRLAKELSQAAEDTSGIIREGDKIVIPQRMELSDAIQTLTMYKRAQEEIQDYMVSFECHPFDGMVCFYRAMKETFGNLLGVSTMSFFGKENGRSYNVPVGPHETVSVPYGPAAIPGLPVEMNVEPNFNGNPPGSLRVTFTCARMYEPVVRQIEKLTKVELAERSIFKGKSINSKYEFLDLAGFDRGQLVYSAEVERAINANILSPIRDSDKWRLSKSPLKRGILLSGSYGTGKTLTALHTAQVCSDNGWTFINVAPGDNIVQALQFARKYQPAVVFFEDIDSLTNGDRSDELNQILNTVDGVLGKGDEVITILTTNHIERINRAMLRPGRLDSIIQLGGLDKPALVKLVTVNLTDRKGKSLLSGELDGDALFKAAENYPPAFVKEGVVKAKAYALARGDTMVESQDVANALSELRVQFELMSGKQEVANTSVDKAIRDVMVEAIHIADNES